MPRVCRFGWAKTINGTHLYRLNDRWFYAKWIFFFFFFFFFDDDPKNYFGCNVARFDLCCVRLLLFSFCEFIDFFSLLDFICCAQNSLLKNYGTKKITAQNSDNTHRRSNDNCCSERTNEKFYISSQPHAHIVCAMLIISFHFIPSVCCFSLISPSHSVSVPSLLCVKTHGTLRCIKM